MSYIVIPIFSDPFLHPLHKDNGLSLLYVQEIGKESNMICQFHPDCVGVLEDYKWLDKHTIITPDAKILNHVYYYFLLTTEPVLLISDHYSYVYI